MAFSLFEYPAANTLTRSIKARLLNASEWNAIVMADDLQVALNALLASDYGRNFEYSTVQANALPSLREVEHVLRATTIGAISKLLRFVHGTPAELLIGLLHRYELMNIKKTLRRLTQQEQRHNQLAIEDYRLDKYGLVPYLDWAGIRDVQALGLKLEKTYYAEVYRDGLAAFLENHDLLVFESMLEKEYHAELVRRVSNLSLIEQVHVSAFTGSYQDEVCLTALTRMRYRYRMDPPAILPLLPLEGCLNLNERIFWKIAAADDEEECMERLGTEHAWQQLAGETVKETVQNIRRTRRRESRKVFLRATPMRLTPLIAYYYLKEQEIIEIISLLQTKRFNLPVHPDGFILAVEAA
jgi:vacuolar-type H+-ATPase subunit C/Vma6